MSLSHITDNNIQTLVNNAKLSKSETERKYSNDPRYTTNLAAQNDKKERIKKWVLNKREANKDLSEEDFIKMVITDYNAPVLRSLIDEFNNIIPNDKRQKLVGLLDKDNISIIDDPYASEMSTDFETGKIVFNTAKLGDETGKTIEDQIVTMLGRLIHEILKLIVNFKKTKTDKDALIKYKLASGKEITLPEGTSGKMLELGYIERLAAEFAEKNGIYYEMDPTLIPMADLCTYMMNSSNKLDNNFMLNNSYDAILKQIDPREAEMIKEAENVALLTHGADEAVSEYENIDPTVIEETWREDPEEESLDPVKIETAVDEIDSTLPDVTAPADNEKDADEEQKEKDILDSEIEKPDPLEVEEIQATNVAYLEENEMSKENKGPVLTMKRVEDLPGYKRDNNEDKGFISIIALLSVIFGTAAMIVFTILYYLNK